MGIIVCQATVADIEGVMALLKATHVSNLSEEERKEGFVTTNITDEQLVRLIEDEDGVTIAKDTSTANGGKIVAFAFAASWGYWQAWPLFQHMIGMLPQTIYSGEAMSVENSYQYGPVCVDKAYRGKGIFERVFFASLAVMEKRFPFMLTFVNKVNPRSHAAHTRKALLDEVGDGFEWNGNNYWVLGCKTSNRPQALSSSE